MKKVISLTLTLSLAAASIILPQYTKNVYAAYTEEQGITSLLTELEIMQGDESGDMMLDKKVSRAELAKIAIAASPQKDSVAIGLKQSPFKDVPHTLWSAPYVKAAVSAGYVVGYLDATFCPENTVTYEEAASIFLRVLGYDDSQLGGAYPYAQLSKAQGLDLLDDVDGAVGEELSRRQVMRMVYNTLNAADSKGAKLISSHGVTCSEHTDIVATVNEDDSLGEDKVLTSAGTYRKGDFFSAQSAGMTGDAYIKNGRDIIAFVPDEGSANGGYETYFVYSVLSDGSVVGYRNGGFEDIDIPDGAAAYKNGQNTSYAAVKGLLKMGDTLYVKYTKNGSVDYVTYDTNNLKGPVKVTGDGWKAKLGANDGCKVLRAGAVSSESAVTVNDIVYYSAPLNVVFAYTDSVTGVYEKASPTKDAPESVTISGKEYKIEGADAFYELSSSGTYKYGDTVTALLGKTGDIAGIAGSASSQVSNTSALSAGFVTGAGKKDFETSDGKVYSSYYASIVSPDGTVREYRTKGDCSTFVCAVVRISFKDGVASLSRSNVSVSGKVNASKGMIGSEYVADDVKILDTTGATDTDVPAYTRVYLQRLDGMTLSSANVMYYSKNSSGEIDELILKDATGDTYTYGIVTKRDSTTGAYTIDIDGAQNTYMTAFKSSATGPHKLLMVGNTVKRMQQISSYQGLISSLTQTEAVINSEKYLLSDSVKVYRLTGVSTYMKIPIEEAISGNYSMTAYYDKSQSSGGRIRIIIARDR